MAMYVTRQALTGLLLAAATAAAACDGNGSRVTGVLRTNASLAALSVSAGPLSPAFNASTTSYAVAVPNSTVSTTVSATAQGGATITVNGTAVASGAASPPIALSVGANTIVVVVTNADGLASRTYTITVTRASF